MKIPKPIIPVHTCELGGHQSISHTSQQNRGPREPINLLCNPLNGCIYAASRFEKGAQKGRAEPGAGGPGAGRACPSAGRGPWSPQSALPWAARGPLKHPNEEPECPLKAFVFPSRAASRPAAPLLTQSQTRAEAAAPRPRGSWRQGPLVYETSVRFWAATHSRGILSPA